MFLEFWLRQAMYICILSVAMVLLFLLTMLAILVMAQTTKVAVNIVRGGKHEERTGSFDM